jgi:uncharacterized delta-60 repeat protein
MTPQADPPLNGDSANVVVSQRKTSRRLPPSRRPRLEVLEDRCLLNAGALDTTFGSGGIVTTSLTGEDTGRAMVIQPDGKIVGSGDGGAMVRYNTDGSLDSTFGSGGEVSSSPITGRGIAVYPNAGTPNDGKIVHAGYVQVAVVTKKTTTYKDEFAVARFNPNGSLDTTFGGKGWVTTAFTDSVTAFPARIQPDGKIVIAGSDSNSFLLARYNTDGSLDTTFGTGGTALLAGPAGGTVSVAWPQDLTLQSDGRIVVAGADNNINTPFILGRLNSNGTPDTTFGGGGVVTTTFSNYHVATGLTGIALQTDGKIVATGNIEFTSGPQWIKVIRYDTYGNLDAAFGTGGIATSAYSTNGLNQSMGIALQSDGKIIVAGATTINFVNPWSILLARYDTSGNLDNTFGGGGFVTTAIGTNTKAGANDIAIYPNAGTANDGKIVAFGWFQNGTAYGSPRTYAVVRYLPSEPEIGSFTASPNPVTSGSSTTLAASNITDANPNSSVTQLAFYYYDGTGAKHVLGYGTQTSPGVWTLNYTVNLASGTYTIYAQAQDSDGALGDPLALTLQVM